MQTSTEIPGFEYRIGAKDDPSSETTVIELTSKDPKELDAYEQATRTYLERKVPGLFQLRYRDAFKRRSSAQETHLESTYSELLTRTLLNLGTEYWIVADEAEIHRLMSMHHTFTLLKGGKLHLAALSPKVERILDVGCGTGVWAAEMAKQYPHTEIIGIDISPLQIQNYLPRNVKILKQDIEESWGFPADHFDHINISHLNGCVRDWGELLRRANHHLKPNGTLEALETDFTTLFSDNGKDTPALHFWNSQLVKAGYLHGRTFGIAPHLADRFKDGGFIFNNETVFKMPTKPYSLEEPAQQLGAEWMLNAISGYDAWSTKLFTQRLHFTLEDTHRLLQDVKNEARDPLTHSYFHVHVVTGTKRSSLHISPIVDEQKEVERAIVQYFRHSRLVRKIGIAMLAFYLFQLYFALTGPGPESGCFTRKG
ncbi:MAG: hypothetical protein M4579_002178 [Chaenotheca gracillima]|nr:MAG: hypothetical protein M4579_002178 [Chaenotheca gracillima]